MTSTRIGRFLLALVGRVPVEAVEAGPSRRVTKLAMAAAVSAAERNRLANSSNKD